MKKGVLLLAVVIVMSLFSCKDNNSEIAKDILKDDASTIVVDSPRKLTGVTETDETSNTNNVLTGFIGELKDVNFGESYASCFSQLRIPNNVFVKDVDKVTIDSVCFDFKVKLKSSLYDSLTYEKGKLNRKIKIFSLKKDISNIKRSSELDDSFYDKADAVGESIIDLRKLDTISYRMRYSDKSKNKIFTYKGYARIKLTNEYGKYLLSGNETDYTSQKAFLKKFFGLVISSEESADDVDGLFALYANASILTVHYRQTNSEGKQDTLFSPFMVNSNSMIINKFNHVHTAAVKDAITNQSSEKLYVEGGGGLKTILKFPEDYLNSLYFSKENEKQSTNIINKAQIEIPVVYPDGVDVRLSHIPIHMVLLGYNTKNEIVPLIDYLTSKSFFDGELDEKNMVYRFNIARLIQQVIRYKKDDFQELYKIDLSKGLMLVPDNRRISPSRVMLDGKNINLKVTYTKL